jgi:hypothetical protein
MDPQIDWLRAGPLAAGTAVGEGIETSHAAEQ